jgi:hypothetical protein
LSGSPAERPLGQATINASAQTICINIKRQTNFTYLKIYQNAEKLISPIKGR